MVINMDDWSEEKKKLYAKMEADAVAKDQKDDWRHDIEDNLHVMLNNTLTNKGYSWGRQAHLNDEGDRHEVDIVGKPDSKGKKTIYIEVEADRTTSVRNVIKVWLALHEKTINQAVVFIQVFSPNYIQKRRGKKVETVFIGQRAEAHQKDMFEYHHIQLESWIASDELATKYIVPLLKQLKLI